MIYSKNYLAITWGPEYADNYTDMIPTKWLRNGEKGRRVTHFFRGPREGISRITCNYEAKDHKLKIEYPKEYAELKVNKDWGAYSLIIDFKEKKRLKIAWIDEFTEKPSSKGIKLHQLVDDLDLDQLSVENSAWRAGPSPAEWSKLVSRGDGVTYTYLLRFGAMNIWKIGISQNPDRRVQDLNYSVPTASQWIECERKEWPSGQKAYEMEQALLKDLKSPGKERVYTDKRTILRAWKKFE